MKIKLDTEFKALGRVLSDRSENTDGSFVDSPITMKSLLMSHYAQPVEKQTAEKKIERATMAQKVFDAKVHIELTMSQFVEFRTWVEKSIDNPLLFKAVNDTLDTYEKKASAN